MPSGSISFTDPTAPSGHNPWDLDFGNKGITAPGTSSKNPFGGVTFSDPTNPTARGVAVPNTKSSDGGGFSDFLGNGGADLIGGGASLLTSLFASNPDKDKASGLTDKLSTLADSLSSTGAKTASTGLDAIQPVIKYLHGLLSGNPADVQAATAPERASILDQYDTARKTLERTAPRGGGQVSAQGDLEAKKASQIATTTATARSGAADKMSQLGTTLTGQGLSAEAYAGSDLAAAVQAAQRAAEKQAQTNEDAGSSIGSAISTGLKIAAMFI